MATRYTLEQIREFIACPELGDDHYGKWGAMTREQRLVMNDLIERVKEQMRNMAADDLEPASGYFQFVEEQE